MIVVIGYIKGGCLYIVLGENIIYGTVGRMGYFYYVRYIQAPIDAINVSWETK